MALSEYASQQLRDISTPSKREVERFYNDAMKTNALLAYALAYKQHVIDYHSYLYKQQQALLAAEYGEAVEVGPTFYDCDCY